MKIWLSFGGYWLFNYRYPGERVALMLWGKERPTGGFLLGACAPCRNGKANGRFSEVSGWDRFVGEGASATQPGFKETFYARQDCWRAF